MARTRRDSKLTSRESRSKLAARKAPYWRPLIAGTALGYAKGSTGGAWVVRQRQADGSYATQRLGTADDYADADGQIVLSYQQAHRLALKIQIKQQHGHARHYGDGATLNDVFETYIVERKTTPGARGHTMAESTAKVAEQFWNRRVRDSLGKQLLRTLSADALRRWHADLARAPRTVRGVVKSFDPKDPKQVRQRKATANRILTIVKAALSWARQTDKLAADMPDWWRNVKPHSLNGDDPEPRMLERDEITRLLNAASPDLRDLLLGALMTGARYGELARLKVSDYSTETGTVRLYQSKSYKSKVQPLTPEGIALFERLTVGREGGSPLFTSANGQGWGDASPTRQVREVMAAAGIADASFKTLRATYGKLLLLATRDIEIVARALGHSDSRITRKHYAAYMPDEVSAAVQKLPALGGLEPATVRRLSPKPPTATQERRRRSAGKDA